MFICTGSYMYIEENNVYKCCTMEMIGPKVVEKNRLYLVSLAQVKVCVITITVR